MPGWCTKVRFADYNQGAPHSGNSKDQRTSNQLFVSERYFRLPQQARGSPATGRTRQTTVENYKLSDLLHWIGRFLCRETLVNPQLAKYLRRYQLTGIFRGSGAWAAWVECKSGRYLVSRTGNECLPLRIFLCASDNTMAASMSELWTGLNSGRTWRGMRRDRISHARC